MKNGSFVRNEVFMEKGMHGILKIVNLELESKKMVLQTLFSWRVLWHSSQVSMLAEFLDLCVIFKLKACLCGLLLYTPCVHGFRPLRF
jgi:hypothetical protein